MPLLAFFQYVLNEGWTLAFKQEDDGRSSVQGMAWEVFTTDSPPETRPRTQSGVRARF